MSLLLRFGKPSGGGGGGTSWQILKIGGGGYMIKMDLSADGLTKLCSSDVTGFWMWNSATSSWRDLLIGFPTSARGGVASYDACSAPSNSAIIYAYMNDGFLYRSLDRGVTFVQLTGFSSAPCGTNNGPTRFNGRRIACDPINQDVLLIATPANGVFVCSNASQGTGSTPSFLPVSGIATSDVLYGYNVAFDPNGGTTSGKTNVSFIFSNFTGMYKATAPLGSYTLTTSGPTGCSNLVVSGNSIVYVTDETASIHKYASGSWSTLTVPGGTNTLIHSIAVDPNPAKSNTRLVAGDQGGFLFVSNDSGATWTQLTNVGTNISPTIPWLATTNDSYKSNGNMMFDPSLTNTLMFAEGVGIYKTNPPDTNVSYAWTVQTDGIENLIPTAITASPSVTGTPIVSVWDRFAFYISDPDQYRTNQLPNNTQEISMCWDLDWAMSDQRTILGAGNDPIAGLLDRSGLSTDDGQTWKYLPPSTDGSKTFTTSASSAAGTNTITLGTSFPKITFDMQVQNLTNPASIPAGTYVTRAQNTQTLITLNNNIVSPGVSSGDTIRFSFPSSPFQKALTTNAQTLIGNDTLHFASVPSFIVCGLSVATYDSTGGNMGNDYYVKSATGTTIVLNKPLSAFNVSSGETLIFYWGPGGSCAISSPTNFIMSSGHGDPSFPYVTNDGGATWTAIDISGTIAPCPRAGTGDLTNGSTLVTNTSFNTNTLVLNKPINSPDFGYFGNATVANIVSSTSFNLSVNANATVTGALLVPETGWGHANYLRHKICVADKVTACKFYLLSYITGKLYVSTSNGANGTWTIANFDGANTDLRTNLNMTGGQGMMIRSVPGQAGHLFCTNANSGNSALGRSIDSGRTWTGPTGVNGVLAIGFGKPKPGGGGYPTVFIAGRVTVGATTTSGIFRSDDNCLTWVQLNPYGSTNMFDMNPFNALDVPCFLEGDQNTYGKVYVGFSQSGFCYYS